MKVPRKLQEKSPRYLFNRNFHAILMDLRYPGEPRYLEEPKYPREPQQYTLQLSSLQPEGKNPTEAFAFVINDGQKSHLDLFYKQARRNE